MDQVDESEEADDVSLTSVDGFVGFDSLDGVCQEVGLNYGNLRDIFKEVHLLQHYFNYRIFAIIRRF